MIEGGVRKIGGQVARIRGLRPSKFGESGRPPKAEGKKFEKAHFDRPIRTALRKAFPEIPTEFNRITFLDAYLESGELSKLIHFFYLNQDVTLLENQDTSFGTGWHVTPERAGKNVQAVLFAKWRPDVTFSVRIFKGGPLPVGKVTIHAQTAERIQVVEGNFSYVQKNIAKATITNRIEEVTGFSESHELAKEKVG